MNYLIIKRKFTATHFDKGSEKRADLNNDSITSEYQPSYKWVLIKIDKNKKRLLEITFKTRKEAYKFTLTN